MQEIGVLYQPIVGVLYQPIVGVLYQPTVGVLYQPIVYDNEQRWYQTLQST